MFSDLGPCLGLWGFLRLVGTSLDGVGWSTFKNRSKQVRVRVAYRENMNVHVHKNMATSRRSQKLNFQCRDVGIQRRDILE